MKGFGFVVKYMILCANCNTPYTLCIIRPELVRFWVYLEIVFFEVIFDTSKIACFWWFFGFYEIEY